MIKVFKQFSYKGCPVILRQTDKWTYEYLLIFEDKFYGTFIKNKLKWYQLHRFFWKDPATNKETNGMIHFLRKAAETTIETLTKMKEYEKKNKNKKISSKPDETAV